MRTTKVFSVEDGTINISANDIYLFVDSKVLATTNKLIGEYNRHILPSNLIRTPKSDEELAEEMYPYQPIEGYLTKLKRDAFLAGRKSFGDKKYYLSEEGLANILVLGSHYDFSLEQIVKYITLPIYPTSITVEHDGEKYIWGTLKAEY